MHLMDSEKSFMHSTLGIMIDLRIQKILSYLRAADITYLITYTDNTYTLINFIGPKTPLLHFLNLLSSRVSLSYKQDKDLFTSGRNDDIQFNCWPSASLTHTKKV